MNQKEVAERISADLAAMARDAREAKLDTLAYLLDVARIEAEAQSGRTDG